MMPTLASIPEAHTPLPGASERRPFHRTTASFERIRPRSRVLVLSRRPTRVRQRPRHVSSATGFSDVPLPMGGRYNHPSREHIHIHRQPGHAKDSIRQTSAAIPPRITSQTRRFHGVSSIDHVLESSESSVDLDSFPLPPSNRRRLHNPWNSSRPVPASPVVRDPIIKPAAQSPVGGAGNHVRYGDGDEKRRSGAAAADIIRNSRHTSIDSALVEAITRTIVQQLRLFSAIKQTDRRNTNSSQPSPPHSSSQEKRSTTSGRPSTLDRFTKHLHEYAEHVGAMGKTVPIDTCSAPSGESLRTISALLPFRPEFRAAGLAVTSRDQAPTKESGHTHTVKGQPKGNSQDKCVHPSQMDGYHEGVSSTSVNTEISFANDQDMDEWRYALIDEAPKRKEKRPAKPKKSRKNCLPCFKEDERPTTDTDWAHFRPARSKSAHKTHRDASTVVPQLEKPLPPCPPKAQPSGNASKTPSPGHSEQQPELRVRSKETRQQVVLEPTPESQLYAEARKISQTSNHSDMLDKPYEERLSKKRYRLFSSQRAPDKKPQTVGSQSVQDQLQVGLATVDSPAVRPWRSVPGHATSQTIPKPSSAVASELKSGNDASMLPRTRQRQANTASGLQHEKTSRPVTEGKPISTARKRRISVTRRPSRNVSCYDPDHIGICCRSSRGVPSSAQAPPNIPKRTSSIRGAIDSDESDPDDRRIADRDVLRGLHVAASAACDEEVDAFVRGRTGLRIRRFLADLIALEAFGGPRLGEDSESRVHRRRMEMRKLKQQVRRSRDLAASGGLF